MSSMASACAFVVVLPDDTEIVPGKVERGTAWNRGSQGVVDGNARTGRRRKAGIHGARILRKTGQEVVSCARPGDSVSRVKQLDAETGGVDPVSVLFNVIGQGQPGETAPRDCSSAERRDFRSPLRFRTRGIRSPGQCRSSRRSGAEVIDAVGCGRREIRAAERQRRHGERGIEGPHCSNRRRLVDPEISRQRCRGRCANPVKVLLGVRGGPSTTNQPRERRTSRA